MRRLIVLLLPALTVSGAAQATPATVVDALIGRLGATVTGRVWWDCYRDLVSNVVLMDRKTGIHLAQWNM